VGEEQSNDAERKELIEKLNERISTHTEEMLTLKRKFEKQKFLSKTSCDEEDRELKYREIRNYEEKLTWEMFVHDRLVEESGTTVQDPPGCEEILIPPVLSEFENNGLRYLSKNPLVVAAGKLNAEKDKLVETLHRVQEDGKQKDAQIAQKDIEIVTLRSKIPVQGEFESELNNGDIRDLTSFFEYISSENRERNEPHDITRWKERLCLHLRCYQGELKNKDAQILHFQNQLRMCHKSIYYKAAQIHNLEKAVAAGKPTLEKDELVETSVQEGGK